MEFIEDTPRKSSNSVTEQSLMRSSQRQETSEERVQENTGEDGKVPEWTEMDKKTQDSVV